jgi:6-pyruvoyltetrahydropterin/6-carboxytetrahydropterin synthase
MFRLTRQVRMAVHSGDEPTSNIRNGHAGFPPLLGLEPFVVVQVTLGGTPEKSSGYLVNIKQIDETVRRDGLPLLKQHLGGHDLPQLTGKMFDRLKESWPGLEETAIALSPFTAYSVRSSEHPMVRFSQKFEFSAAHRLHNPDLDAAANAALFGKCNNPNGHGHNYELQVTLCGRLIPVAKLEAIVLAQVISRFDHKFLNLDTPEFSRLNPTVENIAETIYKLLKTPLADAGADLAAVTVWETPKTWCEYAERPDDGE